MANKVYVARESVITLSASGGTYVINGDGVSAGTGSISARIDLGAASTSGLYTIRGRFQGKTSFTFTVGDAIELYLFTSDGTYADSNTSSSASSAGGWTDANKKKNAIFVGAVIADVTTAGTDYIATFQDVPIKTRYVSVGMWNAGTGSASTNNTANTNQIFITPQPDEIQ